MVVKIPFIRWDHAPIISILNGYLISCIHIGSINVERLVLISNYPAFRLLKKNKDNFILGDSWFKWKTEGESVSFVIIHEKIEQSYANFY